MSNTALAGILAKTLLNLGPRRIPSGSLTDVATVDNGNDSKVMTVYSYCNPLGPPDAGAGFNNDQTNRVRLFATLTRAGSNLTGEVPPNRHFTVAAQRLTIRAGLYPKNSQVGDPLSAANERYKADVTILVADGNLGDGAQPSLWEHFQGPYGAIANYVPINFLGASGYNAGATGRYLRFQEYDFTTAPNTQIFSEFYVPPLSPFSLDLAPDGLFSFWGVEFIASATRGGPCDFTASFRVDARYSFF